MTTKLDGHMERLKQSYSYNVEKFGGNFDDQVKYVSALALCNIAESLEKLTKIMEGTDDDN